MTILHVTDFHFNQRWFDWLLHRAPPHDLLVMSGDLLDIAGPVPHRAQIDWVSNWISDYPAMLCVCSGQHDREWDPHMERWTPAYWLRDLANPRVWVDGQCARVGELSVLNIGCTSRPKGGDADFWVVHAPPTDTLVSRRTSGGDDGDPELGARVARYRPLIVFSGRVHDPVRWRDHRSDTLYLNPGCDPAAGFPHHILVDAARMSYRRVTADTVPPGDAGFPLEEAALFATRGPAF